MWLYVVCLMLAVGPVSGVSPVTTCTDGENSKLVPLTCNSSEMIHVESYTYYNGSNCTQALIDKILCRPPSTDSSSGFTPQCNGQNTSCDEYVHGCQAAQVDYRCIHDTEVYNMCADFDLNQDNINNVFLSTPNFPQLSTWITSAPCTCSIRGTNITSINILDLLLSTAGDGTRPTLLINYGDKIYNKTSRETTTRRVVNDYLTTTGLTSFTVQLNHNMKRVKFWMEIQGNNMVVNCSPTSLTNTSTSQTTTTTTTSPSTTTTTSPVTITSATTSATTTLPVIATQTVPTSPSTATTAATTLHAIATQTVPTSPSTATTSAATTTDKQTGEDDYLPIIAGAVGAAVVLIVALVIIVIVCKRRQNSSYDKPLKSKEDDSPDYRNLARNGGGGEQGVTHAGFVESAIDEGVDLDDNSSDIHSGRVRTMTNGVEYTVVNKPRISGRKPVNSQTTARGDEEIQYADIDPGVQYADIDTAATYADIDTAATYADIDTAATYADIDTAATYGGTKLQVVPSYAVYAQVNEKSKSPPGQDNSPPPPGQDNSSLGQDNPPPLPCQDNSPHDEDNSSDLILLENPMYVSMEDAEGMSGGPGTVPTQSDTDTPSQEPDTLEILENALYVPLEEMQKRTT